MDRFSCLIVLCAIFGVLLHCVAAQNVHVVGDGLGWAVPPNPSAYSSWASGKTFMVGDILVFNFTTNAHDVLQVSEASYTACTPANATGTIITVGPANITLDSSGAHYYICTVGRHCSFGQKLNITVVSSTPGGTNPPAAAPPATPATPGPASPPVDSPAAIDTAPSPANTPGASPRASPSTPGAANPPTAFPPATNTAPATPSTNPGAGGPSAALTPPPPGNSASTSLAAGFLLSLLSAGIAMIC
ncbi:hypothetical protein OROGR_029000 [Orobanche gracilis]